MTIPLVAMVSYQSADRDSAARLRDELTLRGMVTIYDRASFRWGARLADEMEDGWNRCDAFVACITPAYLYEGLPNGQPRPALDSEFIPVMQRRRRALAEPHPASEAAATVRPIIYPVVRGLGNVRSAAPGRVRAATGEDIGGLWTPEVDQGAGPLPIRDAGLVARKVLEDLLPRGGSATTDGYEVVLVTRGTDQPPGEITIDATALLGGPDRRVGDPANWSRLLTALRDVEAVMKAHGRSRSLKVHANAHISAALLFGRIFNQAAGWRLRVVARHGDALSGIEAPDSSGLNDTWEPQDPRADWISVEIDLLGQPVFDQATEWLRTTAQSPRGRLQLSRTGARGDLLPDRVSMMAARAADVIRTRVASERPRRLALMCASPVEFATLLGHRLTSLFADIELLERGDEGYTLVLTLPATA